MNTTKPPMNEVKEMNESAAREWLRSKVADILGIDIEDIDVDRPLTDYGIESRQVLVLVGDIEDLLGRKLPATLAWDHPTVAAMATFVAGHRVERETGT